MSADDCAVILEMLQGLKEDMGEVKAGIKLQNGRVRAVEVAVATLQWAVYIGGGSLVSIVSYLIYKHLAI